MPQKQTRQQRRAAEREAQKATKRGFIHPAAFTDDSPFPTTVKDITHMNVDEFLPYPTWEYERKVIQIQEEDPSVTWEDAMDDLSSRLMRITDPGTRGYRGLIPAELDTASGSSKYSTIETMTGLAKGGFIIWDPLNRAHVLSTPARHTT